MKCVLITSAVVVLVCSTLHAQIIIGGGGVPQMINYQGRVVVGSTNFDGTGQFKFALVSANGIDIVTYWSNDGSSTGGSEPAGTVSLNVAKGLYSVLLGDTSLTNMTAIPVSVFNRNEVYLRVWFNDGTHGSQLLTPDQRIAAVGYAMMAGNVADGSITSAKLASNLSLIGTFTVGNLDLTPPSGGNPAGTITQGGTSLIHTFGSYNFFAGLSAGNSTMQRDYNTAIGSYSFQANTFGADNTAVGFSVLTTNTTGSDNTAIGFEALYGNTTGNYNTVSGSLALDNNTIGNENTVSGYSALNSNKSAGLNVAIGSRALELQSYDPGFAWASENVAVGYFALGQNQPTSTSTGVDNTAVGMEALFGNKTGSNNTASGGYALLSNTTGGSNTAGGYGALYRNTTGSNNIALGHNAGEQLTTGNNNIDIGHGGLTGETGIIRIGDGVTQTDTYLTGIIHGDGSHLTGITLPATSLIGTISSAQLASGLTLSGITTGNDFNLPPTTSATAGVITQNGSSLIQTYGTGNFFAGSAAGNFSMTGNYNTASGANALKTNATGSLNTASGEEAMRDNTKGDDNTASGFEALLQNTTAGRNVAIGSGALLNQNFDNGGVAWDSNNVAVGYQALASNYPDSTGNGYNNTAVGTNALTTNSRGSWNTASGANALQANATGDFNTASGANALKTNATGSLNTASGEEAMRDNTKGDDNTASGFEALLQNTTAGRNVAIGSGALLNQNFDNGGVAWDSNNVAVGYQALASNYPDSTGNGYNNTAVGTNALTTNSRGSWNTASGANALQANATGDFNTASGANALKTNATGSLNTASGEEAMRDNTKGDDNTASGFEALLQNTTAGQNVAIGSGALLNQSYDNGGAAWSSNNVAVGYQALASNAPNSINDGTNNTALGANALTANSTGTDNTAIGSGSLSGNTTGSENIALGDAAGSNITTGYHNIEIGNVGRDEASTIRIGTISLQTATYISGIRGATTGVNDAVAVVIDTNGQLGTISSSRRYKEDIADMGDASARLLTLRPVSFHYKKPYANGEKPVQYGLIAEEVAKAFPELAVLNKEGQPETVKYQDLPPLLLNEFLKEHQRVLVLEKQLAELEARDKEREARLTRIEQSVSTARNVSIKVASTDGN